MSNLKSAIRSLAQSPGFTFISILTLAMGMGATVSMFSLMNALLLRPLSFSNSENLFRVHRTTQHTDRGDFSPADFIDLRNTKTDVAQFAAFAFSSVSLSENGRPAEWFNSLRVSQGFFETLGASLQIGRSFRPEENIRGNHHVIVLNHQLWQDQFGADPNVIGRVVRLNSEPYEIVGVVSKAASDRRLFGNSKLFVPLAFSETEENSRNATWLNLIARRGENVSTTALKSFLTTFAAGLASEHPAENKNTSWRAIGLLQSTMNPTGRALVTMLVGLSGVVLLIACSNLANLLLARAMGRTREFAVRAALGASRRQIISPIGWESLALVGAGAAGALFCASWVSDWLTARLTAAGENTVVQLDWRVVAFTLIASLITSLAFGLAPALFAMRVKVNEALKLNSRGASAGKGHQRFRGALIIAQFAMAMTLLAGAGLFLRGANAALNAHNGWSSDQVLQGTIHPPKNFRGGNDLNIFFMELIQRLQSIPGVEQASISYGLPYKGLNNLRQYTTENPDQFRRGDEPRVLVNGISAGYFSVTGTRLLNGRAFTEADVKNVPNVAIISESMARRLFGNENPIGRRIVQAGSDDAKLEVVGVVSDVRSVDVAQNPINNQLYHPITQDHWYYGEGRLVPIYLAIRTAGASPESLAKAFREAVAAVDPDLAVRELMTANTMIERFASQIHVIKNILASFAASGLFLAALGIYGVLSRTVAQRTPEIGIRMALGARVSDTIRLILSSGLKLTVTGAVLGLIGAFVVSQLLAKALPSMQTNAGLILPLAGLGLFAVGLIACYLPARRAARINPLVALRAE